MSKLIEIAFVLYEDRDGLKVLYRIHIFGFVKGHSWLLKKAKPVVGEEVVIMGPTAEDPIDLVDNPEDFLSPTAPIEPEAV